ncbi:MAG: RluA family pseudouridine synthase [Proteobacteria bacterium]|nr:RluA family pseudouridine synthase [Pseudomonadota bacterium]
MAQGKQKVRFEVLPADAGRRLDQVLAARIPQLSRRKARVLLDIGGVFVDRKRVKVASRTMRPGQIIEVTLGGALERANKSVGRSARRRDASVLPAFTIAHEDDDIVVVDKPCGLITAPTPESDRGNLADLLRQRASSPTIHVVHRLDLETSGLLILAKTATANRILSEWFREHAIEREYIAVVAGPLGRSEAGERAIRVAISGRPAITHVRLIEPVGDVASVIRARLETGRTHQIRIHCHHIGHPVLGDPRYGPSRPGGRIAPPPRLALHAATLGLPHPTSGQAMRFDSPLPSDLAQWLAAARAAATENLARGVQSRPSHDGETMVERYVFMRLDKEYTDSRQEIVAHTQEVLRALPGVVSAHVGTPADSHAESAWDLCAVVRFDSLDDVEPYRVHPDHRRLVDEYLSPRIQVVKAWNFDIKT